MDPCECALSDPTQTGVFAQVYPETAALMAYSYQTCAQCHHRKTELSCSLHSGCGWDKEKGACGSLLRDDFTVTSCAAKTVDQCGGELNLGCKFEKGTCIPRDPLEVSSSWGCPLDDSGDSKCRCLDPVKQGMVPRSDAIKLDAMGQEKLLYTKEGDSSTEFLLPTGYGARCQAFGYEPVRLRIWSLSYLVFNMSSCSLACLPVL